MLFFQFYGQFGTFGTLKTPARDLCASYAATGRYHNGVFAANESEKLVLLGDTRQDLTWAEAVPDKYLAAKAMIML